MIEAITNTTSTPKIVHAVPTGKGSVWKWESKLIKVLLGTKGQGLYDLGSKNKKIKTFNVIDAKRDFENCNGWSLTVTQKRLHALKGSNIAAFMVNLTEVSLQKILFISTCWIWAYYKEQLSSSNMGYFIPLCSLLFVVSYFYAPKEKSNYLEAISTQNHAFKIKLIKKD